METWKEMWTYCIRFRYGRHPGNILRILKKLKNVKLFSCYLTIDYLGNHFKNKQITTRFVWKTREFVYCRCQLPVRVRPSLHHSVPDHVSAPSDHRLPLPGTRPLQVWQADEDYLVLQGRVWTEGAGGLGRHLSLAADSHRSTEIWRTSPWKEEKESSALTCTGSRRRKSGRTGKRKHTAYLIAEEKAWHQFSRLP